MYEKFAELLVKNNKTAYAVSKETGISQSVLSDWKRGRSNPKVDKLQKLADFFGRTGSEVKKDADRNFSCAIDDSDSKSNLLEIMFPGRTSLYS